MCALLTSLFSSTDHFKHSQLHGNIGFRFLSRIAMSQWLTSGRNRLLDKQNQRFFSSDTQKRKMSFKSDNDQPPNQKQLNNSKQSQNHRRRRTVQIGENHFHSFDCRLSSEIFENILRPTYLLFHLSRHVLLIVFLSTTYVVCRNSSLFVCLSTIFYFVLNIYNIALPELYVPRKE